jgi:ferredoxin
MLRISIDRHKCIGSGNCLYWAPATFDLDDEGVAVVVDAGGDAEDRILVAAEGCPSKAITVEPGAEVATEPADEVDTEVDREGPRADRPVR